MIRRTAFALVLLAACGGGVTATTASPSTTGRTTAGATTITSSPAGLPGFATDRIALGELQWMVAVADTPGLRRRGLMGVTDLGGLDGMLFIFEGDTTSRFWMKGTLIPLDIAFFDSDGIQVGEVITMIPCEEDPCPTYGVDVPYRHALETTVGGFEGLELVLTR